MPKDSRLTWFDGLLKRTGVPYPLISFFLGVIIYVAYLFLGKMLEAEWLLQDKIEFALMGFLIAYQLSGIQYLLDQFKKIIWDICLFSTDIEDNFCAAVTGKFVVSVWYYILVAAVILPFYLTDWINSDYTLKENYTLMEQFVPNFTGEPSFWMLVYDIYNDLLGLLALILLAYILWIILNIAWTIRNASLNFHGHSLITNAFSIQMKLRPIKGSILGIMFYYFICISLLIISYGLDVAAYYLEKMILSVLLLIGLIFFFIGYESINNMVKVQIELELDQINKKSREYTQKLVDIDSKGDYDPKIQETNFISNMLDVLQKQREVLTKVNTKGYDLKSIISIISAFFLPILTDVAKKNLGLILGSGDLINQGVSLLRSLIHK